MRLPAIFQTLRLSGVVVIPIEHNSILVARIVTNKTLLVIVIGISSLRVH